ncbi:drh-3, partial [Pristionchus pacificus]
SEVMREHFPFMKDGDINPELMSFAKLYLDEIVEKVLAKYDDPIIGTFLEALDAKDVQLTKDDAEWLVDSLLRSKKGFIELYNFLHTYHKSLLDQITLFNEGSLYKEVVDAFKQYFLRPAHDLATERLKDMADNIEIEDSDEESYLGTDEESETTVDSDDSLPENYVPKKRKRRRPVVEPVEVVEEVEELEYGYVDTVLDRIQCIFDPEFALNSLIAVFPRLKDITDPLNTPANAATMKYSPWARAILRQLPRQSPENEELPKFPSIVFKFARACEHDPINRVVLMYLLPDYHTQLDARNAAIRARLEKGGIKMDMVTTLLTNCRPPDDYKNLRREALHEHQTTVMPIKLREYQKELVEKANLGENTVIVAPTGCGKTVVAAQIMRHHVMTSLAKKKPYRMIMVVPKIPLVEQQQKQLYQYMNDVVYSTTIHGDMMFEEQGKIDKVLCAELIVMTAQILLNLLQSVRSKERLFVSDITMLILDECHHCDSSHPYAQLMQIIRDWEHDKPQVIGLTASLGVGKDGGINEKSAYDHVLKLLVNMSATSITTVVNNLAELQTHVQLPVDDIKDVKRSSEGRDLPFTAHLMNYMNSINMDIRGKLLEMIRPGNEYGVLIPQSIVKSHVDYNETEKYGGRLESIKQLIRPMKDGVTKSSLNMSLDILKVCNMAWGMNDLLPSSKVWTWMKVEMNLLRHRNPDHKAIRTFYDQYENVLESNKLQEEDNDMLKALRTELKEQMKKNRNSKVIIFVATREMSESLYHYINDINDMDDGHILGEGRECGFIISSKARGVGTVSQTPAQQTAALNKFRNNQIAVLVSTTVAEEGLDVPECNLIIKYNMTGNVISLTQQRGRARAKGSRSVLIVLSGSVMKRELENANAEKMMNHVVKKIHREGEMKLKDAVEKLRISEKKREDQLKKDEATAKDKLKEKLFDILCGNCNQRLCDSFRIKKGSSHYFACDTQIWQLFQIEFNDSKGKYVDLTTAMVGKVLCKGDSGKCGHELGKVVRYDGCYLPALKCASLQLRNKKDNKIEGMDGKSTKWNDVCKNTFYITQISQDELKEMSNALSMGNVELFEKLEGRFRELHRKARRDAMRKYDMKKDEDFRGAESD